MGMFDEVIADFKCPYCMHVLSAGEIEESLETKNETWQTKVTRSLMEMYRVGDKLKFKSDIKISDKTIGLLHTIYFLLNLYQKIYIPISIITINKRLKY